MNRYFNVAHTKSIPATFLLLNGKGTRNTLCLPGSDKEVVINEGKIQTHVMFRPGEMVSLAELDARLAGLKELALGDLNINFQFHVHPQIVNQAPRHLRAMAVSAFFHGSPIVLKGEAT